VLAGWIVTESGRQPWVVHGILRTADATSPVAGSMVLLTLILFVVVYTIVFSFGIFYINRLIAAGPQGAAVETPRSFGPPIAAAEQAGKEALGKS
jgi:cytochrome bd ubiquinol oxidase subunit I